MTMTEGSGWPVFVFGSNLAGRHGKGAAKWALQFRGAVYGQGIGHHGKSYALPTKDENMKVLPLYRIHNYADQFKRYARENPDLQFQLTPVGCGHAGYEVEQIAPMFENVPENVILPTEFKAVLQGLDP